MFFPEQIFASWNEIYVLGMKNVREQFSSVFKYEIPGMHNSK